MVNDALRKICMRLAFAWLALMLLGPVQAAVPRFNGHCPGGLEVRADDSGKVYVDGREARLERISNDYFEARDARADVTLSIMRSTDGDLNVSYTGRGGANGICSIVDRHSEPEPAPREVADLVDEVGCEAPANGQAECPMDTRGEVRLLRQSGSSRCVLNENWGLYRHAVWVRNGCGGVFRRLADRAVSAQQGLPAQIGGVLLDACDTRANADGVLVNRVAVNDDVTELIIDYPEGRFLCMVRNDGLVESLTRLRRR